MLTFLEEATSFQVGPIRLFKPPAFSCLGCSVFEMILGRVMYFKFHLVLYYCVTRADF